MQELGSLLDAPNKHESSELWEHGVRINRVRSSCRKNTLQSRAPTALPGCKFSNNF